MKITYCITGERPAMVYSLLKYFDLGIEKIFTSFGHKLICELKKGISKEKLYRQPGAIKLAYEDAGCINVRVTKTDT